MHELSLERAIRAVEKVRERLLNATAVLERHGIRYAVIGGHAVAVHVARVDDDAVRNTVDVDLLINRDDLSAVKTAMGEIGFEFAEVNGVPLFVESASPSPRRGIHLVFAAEKVRPNDLSPAPTLDQVERSKDGFFTIRLASLLSMKLTANRDKDRTHIRDMLELEMITPDIEAQLPPELRARLVAIRENPQ